MMGKGKQFKIERKKLVISKDCKARQEEKQSKYQHKFQGHIVNQKRSSYHDKRDAQPLKQYRLRSSSRDIMLKNDQLLLEKKSAVYSSSKEMETKESELQKNPYDFRMIWRNTVVQELLRQLIQKMKNRQLSFHSQNNYYLIQKDYFVHLLEYMICIFSSTDLVQCHRLFHKVSELKDSLMSINDYCFNLKAQSKRNPLSLQSGACQFQISHQDYYSSLRESINLVEYYNNSAIALEQRVKQLGQEIRVKEKYSQEISQQVSHKHREVDGLFLKIAELELRQEDLERDIEAKTIKIEGLTTQIKKLQNYGCQNRELIRLVSQQYKEIQSNIYQYAVYLQSNELASQLGYEPHPFTAIQQALNNEYKGLQELKRDCSKASLQSLRYVWEVQDRMITFYKKKDQQMTKLGEFKTKCVKQFINHMKKWLNNWELKQEFLVNLRSQFAADTQAFHKCFDNLNGMVRESREERTIECLQELQSIYNRIEENYKLGNSFY